MSKNTKPFEKRFYNESSITYETAPGQGFEVSFSREDREVEILHISDKGEFTYKAAAHPDDQYDEQFGFELAAARLWEVSLGPEAIQDFIYFRAYVWGVKGWGVLDLAQFHERWPRVVSDLLAASKDPSFRQRVVELPSKPETPFEIITRYKETTKRGKADRKTALQLWKDLKDAGYTPVDVRNPKTGDKFWWSYYCLAVLELPETIPYWGDDPVLILAKTVKETPVASKPEPTQEEKWIAEETAYWHQGETSEERARRIRSFLVEKGFKVVGYRDPKGTEYRILMNSVHDPIETHTRGTIGKRLIVEPITPVPSPDDEKALNFIRQEFREDGNERFISKAEGLLKQYREWGFEPVDYRQVRVGEYYGSAYTGYHPEQRTERESYLNFLIFRKRS